MGKGLQIRYCGIKDGSLSQTAKLKGCPAGDGQGIQDLGRDDKGFNSPPDRLPTS